MQQRDEMTGSKARQRRLELQRFVNRFAHELFDDRLAPGAERALAKAAAESLDPRDADAVTFVRVTVENRDTRVRDDLTHLVTLTRFEVVIAQNGNDRCVDCAQLACQDA